MPTVISPLKNRFLFSAYASSSRLDQGQRHLPGLPAEPCALAAARAAFCSARTSFGSRLRVTNRGPTALVGAIKAVHCVPSKYRACFRSCSTGSSHQPAVGGSEAGSGVAGGLGIPRASGSNSVLTRSVKIWVQLLEVRLLTNSVQCPPS